MMPTEMELRVARALRDLAYETVGKSMTPGRMPPPEEFLDEARAAIRAMREPTGTMTKMGSDQLYGWDMDREDRMERATDTWRAMIDAATSVEPEPR